MTSSVRILSTSTIDSSPSILIIANGNNNTNNSGKQQKKNVNTKILINCGEGCQRTFVEYSQKLSSITTACICSLNDRHNHDMVGGLPGAILTIFTDTIRSPGPPPATAALGTSAADTMNTNQITNDLEKQESQSSTKATLEPLSLPFQIFGPLGMKQYLASLRHFMRRDSFHHTIHEAMIESPNEDKNRHPTTILPVQSEQRSKKQQKDNQNRNKDASKSDDTFGFTIQSIAFLDRDPVLPPMSSKLPLNPITTRKRSLDDALLAPNEEQPKHYTSNGCVASKLVGESRNISPILVSNAGGGGCVSFILRTPPIPGKFLVEKAMSLGIPKGPLYRQLKMGQNVSLVDAVTNEVKVVQSSDVVEPATPPIIIMILYYPTENVAQQLFTSNHLRQNIENDDNPELVIHITSLRLFHQYGKCHWTKNHNNSNTEGSLKRKNVDHIFLPLRDLKLLDDTVVDSKDETSPFRSAIMGAYARSLIHSDIYVCPENQMQSPSTSTARIVTKHDDTSANVDEFQIGRPNMEYTILPRSKRGFVPISVANDGDDPPPIKIVSTDKETMEQLVDCSGAGTLAQQIITEYAPRAPKMLQSDGELIFTGTASAVPCKHRNVTGMLLKQSDKRCIILDIGEGTIGQLLRMWSSCEDRQQQCRNLYNEIKAVWISHPHADHHLGLIRLLKDRRQFEKEKLLIIAPTPIFRFLEEISAIDNEVQGTYISIDCKDLMGESPEFLPHQQTIQDMLGITRCRAVPVAHCAHAYAIILDGTSFGRVVYSGDCRPSTQLAIIAKGADVLIHESTFESDMQANAVLKKHCTIDEALNVGRQMECKCIVLTHFSQRYSKIPPIPSIDDYPFPIIYAYDFMRLRPQTLVTASKLTPALRLLFAEDSTENNNDDSDGIDAMESFKEVDILSIPGAFANASLL